LLQKSLFSWKCLDRLPAEHTMITCSVFIQKAHPPKKKTLLRPCNTCLKRPVITTHNMRVLRPICFKWNENWLKHRSYLFTHNGSGKTKTNAITISTEANISLSPTVQDKSQLRIFGPRPPSLFLRASLSRPKADLTPLRPFVTWWSACSKSPKNLLQKSQKNPPKCNSRPIFATVATAAGLTVLWFFHHHQLSYLTSRPKSESHKMICAKKKRCWLLSVIPSWKTSSPWIVISPISPSATCVPPKPKIVNYPGD